MTEEKKKHLNITVEERGIHIHNVSEFPIVIIKIDDEDVSEELEPNEALVWSDNKLAYTIHVFFGLRFYRRVDVKMGDIYELTE